MPPKTALPKVLSLIACLLAFLSPVIAAQKTRVLLITGGHGFQKDPFYKLFADNPDIVVTRAEHETKAGATAYERADLYEFDVVVAYDMTAKSTAAQRAKFKGLFERGIGYVALHHALMSFEDWPEYGRILGGHYPKPAKGKPQVTDAVGYQHDVEMNVTVSDATHPIVAGLKDFLIKDEIYWGTTTANDIRPFLRTTHPKSMNPIGWTRTEGKARIAFLQLGHDRNAFENESFRKLVAQTIRWAAR